MADTPNIAAMTPLQAQSRLDELKANADWGKLLMEGQAGAVAEFHALSCKIAGAEAAAPPPASDNAQAQLDRFTSDKTNAEALLRGDPATLRRFHELSQAVADADGKGDPLVDLIVGGAASEPPLIEMTTGLGLTSREKLGAIAALREDGIGDGAILEAFNGTVATPAEIARVKALKTQLFNDPEWVQKLFAGGYEQKRQMRLINIVLAGAA